jgi:hypothetical protein
MNFNLKLSSAGIEAFQMLRKKQVEIEPAFSDVEWNILRDEENAEVC